MPGIPSAHQQLWTLMVIWGACPSAEVAKSAQKCTTQSLELGAKKHAPNKMANMRFVKDNLYFKQKTILMAEKKH